TSLTYNVHGFRTNRIDELGHRTSYTRDDVTNVVLTAQDETGRVTTYSWGATPSLRQLESVTDPEGRKTTYSYLANGLPQTRKDAFGALTTYTWSNLGLLSTEVDQLG